MTMMGLGVRQAKGSSARLSFYRRSVLSEPGIWDHGSQKIAVRLLVDEASLAAGGGSVGTGAECQSLKLGYAAFRDASGQGKSAIGSCHQADHLASSCLYVPVRRYRSVMKVAAGTMQDHLKCDRRQSRPSSWMPFVSKDRAQAYKEGFEEAI